MSEHVTPDRVPQIHFVESDAIPPATADQDENWWMDHYWCDCGWESHDPHTHLPDGGHSLAEQHAAETGHEFEAARS